MREVFIMTPNQLADEIYHQARLAGYDDCGIIPIEEMDEYQERLQERLQHVPGSRPFYEQIKPTMNSRQRFPWAKSIIICTWWMGRYSLPDSLQGKYARAFFLAPNVTMDDEEKRKKGAFKEWLTAQGLRWDGGDNGIPFQIGGLRHVAMKAGLGIIRKNNFLYTEHGSFVELEGFAIDASCILRQYHDIKPCAPQCHLCQNHCPTQALSAPFTMNPLQCVSFWNTFGKSQLPPGFPEKAMESWIIGCDACQNACPYNQVPSAKPEKGVPELIRNAMHWLDPENMKDASDEVLKEKVLPLCHEHIQELDTLRRSAIRYLKNQKGQ